MTSQAAASVVNCAPARISGTLVETSLVGVVVLNAKTGRPVTFNREARRIVESLRLPGDPPDQLPKAISLRRADGCEVSMSRLPLEELLQSGETMRAEEVMLSVPDGRSVRVLINATPIRAVGAAIDFVVLTIQDLALLDEIERLRAEFLSLMSHELRTPLAAIKGCIATVLDASQALDPVELREFHRIIDEQAENLQGLLDTWRLDTGTFSVSPEPAEVGALVEQARSAFLGGGGRHGLVVDLPSDLPLVMADRRRIMQVLNNLFSNVGRHAPESSPIRVTAAREETHVAVAVSDEGRGVAPELLPRLFTRHGDGGTATGHGPGLAISRGLVEAHGGRIWAESPGVGLGTTITFTLPAAGGAAPAPAGPPAAAQLGEPVRILVVDDDPHTLRFVRDTLSAAGYVPLVTGERRELARIIHAEKPRLVLLDLVLPGPDGIELMQQLPEFPDLPVIFISAYGRDETVVRALEAGAADYIVKPFSPTELVARVRAALRRHEEPEPFVLGDLAIDYHRRRVTVAGNPVPLTATEYELVRVLALQAGRVVTFDTLLRRVWPKRKYKHTGASPLRAFVGSLRRKLGDDAADPTYVLNERGVGYRMPRPGRK